MKLLFQALTGFAFAFVLATILAPLGEGATLTGGWADTAMLTALLAPMTVPLVGALTE